MTGRLERIKAAAQRALSSNGDLLYRHEATWSDNTTCRFSVQEPSKTNPLVAALLQVNPQQTGLRVVKVHPDDPRPKEGSHIPWQGGTLTLERWSDKSDFTDQREGTARYER
ncbi:hypothetical protein [Deinococcus ruber]|uniref:Uncharacterized protein n=1 Tax=Deinococcus ruber TaxID=1848197 RepID=A0A918F8U8_9DEIO|nr:hypothetical protein [Deinococcus ruber]GGR11410.1 hypothetical protein GCM10008957_25230 [Deinococcus ruber]